VQKSWTDHEQHSSRKCCDIITIRHSWTDRKSDGFRDPIIHYMACTIQHILNCPMHIRSDPFLSVPHICDLLHSSSHNTIEHNSVCVQASELSAPHHQAYCHLYCMIALMSPSFGISWQRGRASPAILAAAVGLEAKETPELIGEVFQAVVRCASLREVAALKACLVECKCPLL
jgi:hypothetical protein